ncbi:MAG TPA: DUF2520 domain-containing protein [Pyrinomonadaceae bacterium]|nr:DUF2520 domain-containing protein [Pyrinomonadaceae bacterium]
MKPRRKESAGREGKRKKSKGEGTEKSSSLQPSPVSVSRASSRRPTIAVVGAGRLGTALARALVSCEYELVAVVARRASSARRAAEATGTETLALDAAALDELPAADIIFITTPDDLVASTARRIAAATPVVASKRRRVALHASGALSSEALAALRGRGFGVGSMHPLVSVSEPVAGAEGLRRGFYCVEGDPAAVRAARRIVADLGGRSFSVKTKDKALYHAAAVMTAGHTVALFDAALGLFLRCGLPEKLGRAALVSLLRSTVENLSAQTPARALTGTFARADVETVRKHLDALAAAKSGEVLEIYALLGRRSLRLAKECGAKSKALREIADALDAADARGASRRAAD